MVVTRALLHLAAAAVTTTVVSCFVSPGLAITSTGSASLEHTQHQQQSAVVAPRSQQSTATWTYTACGASTKTCRARATGHALMSAVRATESLSTRGGSFGSDDSNLNASGMQETVRGTTGSAGKDGLGEADEGLAESDPEVWEIITAERRRQVGCGWYTVASLL